MSRTLTVMTLGALLIGAAPALAQPAVEVTPLAAPDAFANGARDTGLPPDLWRGASVETARTVQAKHVILATGARARAWKPT